MLKTMTNAALGLSLFLASTVHGAWIMDGITFHDCQNPTAIREGYCVQGGTFVADLFVQRPQVVELVKYNVLLHPPITREYTANTLIRIPTGEPKPNGKYKRFPYYTIDTVRVIGRDLGDDPLDPVMWRVVNQANREFVIEKSLSIDRCYLWLRGDWTGVPENVGVVPNPIIDATFKYRNTDCED